MTPTLRFRRRWAEPWLPPFIAISYGFLLYLPIHSLGDSHRWGPGSGMRVYLAVLIAAGYWALAIIANWRISTVDATGVRVRLLPFPTGSGHHIGRAAIRHCYVRNIVETTDSDVECANYFAAGVETRQGHQLDVKYRFETHPEALAYAREIAQILNSDASCPALEVLVVIQRRTYPTLKRQFILWSVIGLAALCAGIAWDR